MLQQVNGGPGWRCASWKSSRSRSRRYSVQQRSEPGLQQPCRPLTALQTTPPPPPLRHLLFLSGCKVLFLGSQCRIFLLSSSVHLLQLSASLGAVWQGRSSVCVQALGHHWRAGTELRCSTGAEGDCDLLRHRYYRGGETDVMASVSQWQAAAPSPGPRLQALFTSL